MPRTTSKQRSAAASSASRRIREHAGRFIEALDTVMHRDMQTPKEHVEAMLNITPPEFRSLFWLGRHGTAVMSDFAQGIAVPLSTATRIVNRMVKKGLVVRRRSEKDRRLVEVDLSPIAYEHKARFEEHRLGVISKLVETLTQEERETMLGLLEKAVLLSVPGPAEPHS
ncbi:MAG: MarR family transcriptional regulator [Acidobacteriota bacterium]|nr:MarR family transcriptional regulator [Acidobacteriota bacterium]